MYVAGDAAATAGNVVANAGLVRLGVVSDLVDQTLFIFLALTLYVLLKHVHQSAARAMVVLVALAAAISSLNVVFEFAGLRVATGAVDLSALGTEGSNGMVLLLLDTQHYGLLIAQIFFGLWLVPLGYLSPQIRVVPQGAGVVLVVAGGCYLVDLLTAFLVPDVGQLIHAFIVIPCIIAEIWMLGYLLFIGVRTDQDRAARRAHSRRRLNDSDTTAAALPVAAGFDDDDDIADLLPGLDIAVGRDDLVQRIGSVDQRLELPGLQQSLEVLHHLLVVFRNREPDLLAAMERSDEGQERILGMRAQLRRDVDSRRFQQRLALAEGALAHRVDDHVVRLVVLGEVLGLVVDHPVGTQAPDQFQRAPCRTPRSRWHRDSSTVGPPLTRSPRSRHRRGRPGRRRSSPP